MDIKVAYIKYEICCLQINQVYAIVTIVNNFERNAGKNSSNINISFYTCLFDKNVPVMLQQEGILSVLKIKSKKK